MNKPLLAKSKKAGYPPVSLAGHSLDVLTSTKQLFGESNLPTPLAKSWLRFFGLSDFTNFILNLKIACLFHDIGKANNGFQGAIYHNTPQILRHEHLSALLLLQPPVRNWLKSHKDVYYEGILAAVAGHHLKACNPGSSMRKLTHQFARSENETSWAIDMLLLHTDVSTVFTQVATILGSMPPALVDTPLQWNRSFIDQLRTEYVGIAHYFKKKIQIGSEENRLLLALKAGVIVSDALGSAMPRMDVNPETWVKKYIADCFNHEPLTSEWLQWAIINPRIQEIEKVKGTFTLHDFQKQAAQLGPRSLLLSGCGTGKTLAAWLWIQEQLKNQSARRVIFLYPTRATATEGFRDYVSWAGDDASLIHATAFYDLEGMFKNPPEPDERSTYNYEQDARLYALGAWSKKIFSATADSFLAFMANQYSSMCMFPMLVDSILVVDEVHAFDSKMFTVLEQFLTFFSIPVLCMTASLPSRRQEILVKKCGLQLFPENVEEFEDLKTQMNWGRYQLGKVSLNERIGLAIESVQAGKKVMWVVNTVNQCQELSQQLAGHLDPKALLCYHSRFKLSDRRQRHEDVIRAFKQTSGPLLLITTQVCEMSLDLDADVLITDLAPITSLIQRMGRCCRQPIPKAGRLGLVWITTETEKAKPYEAEDIDLAQAFINHLLKLDRPISQADLTSYLDTLDEGVRRQATDLPTLFTHSGLYSPSSFEDPFRDSNEYTVDCILDTELTEYLKYKQARSSETPGYVVPVPKHLTQASSNVGLPSSLRLAPYTHYSPTYGFCKEEVSDHVRPQTYLIV